jgi:iron complex outermembrane recepter protein
MPMTYDGLAGRRVVVFLRWLLLLITLVSGPDARAQPRNQLATEIASLKNITTVSKQPEPLMEVPSAIQVITAEDIRRSGATRLPEALRLVSNLQVAQIDSRQWAISARGFNSTAAANKLLVLLDGRSVYTPLFSGVFWDVQNLMLENIERIEVVSGPGATLWGANAVNGVINVITKSPRDTQGTLVSAGGGTFLKRFGNVRYGSKIGEDLYFRIYGMAFDQESARLADGRDGTNDWYLAQGGFRADWLPPHGEEVVVRGDYYGGVIAQPAPGDVTVDGQNVTARWTHPLGEDSDMTLQVYWDRTWRRIPDFFAEDLNTFDLDFQHRFPFGQRHRIIYGGGYRLIKDDVGNSRALAFLPAQRTLHLFSGFIQDEIALKEEELLWTLGSKFEHNDYSGFEIQPSSRVAWLITTNHTVWAAVSRAVRSPSRIDTEFFLPGAAPFQIQGGGKRFDSESLIAYEAGYRVQWTPRLGGSVSVFFNDYDQIRSVEPIPGAPDQFVILNGLRAETYGAEFSLRWQPVEWWAWRGGYTFFRKHIFLDGTQDRSNGQSEGNDPQHQVVLHSMLNPAPNWEFDAVIRYVDNLNQLGPTVPAYVTLDLRVAWQPAPNWEISVVGRHLLDEQHPEFGAGPGRQEIPRSVYAKLTWRF